MQVVVLLAIITVVAAASSTPQHDLRIVGGNSTTIQEYPFMGNVLYKFLDSVWTLTCGGSLIMPSSVLSSATCFQNKNPSSIRIRLGSTYREYGGDIKLVSRYVLHPDFDPESLVNDIAIGYLETPAVYSESIGIAALAGAGSVIHDGTKVTALGWGSMKGLLGPFPKELQHVDIDIINQKICADRYEELQSAPNYEKWPKVTDNMICSGILDVGGKGTCFSDIGGPIVYNKYIIVGIISFSFQCADPKYPSVSTRVPKYIDWIVVNAK